MRLFLQLLFLLVAFFSSLFLLLQTRRIRRNREKVVHPPGPQGLPLIGNLHQFLYSFPHLYLYELSKTYGPLVYLKLGFVPTLVVSSAKMAREVMKTHDHIFCSRPPFATHQKLSYNGSDVIFAPYGDSWREFRKVCILNLFTSKKVQSFSPIREEEVHHMTQKISLLSTEGKPVDLSQMLMCLTSTVICRIAFGRSYDDYDARCGRSFQDMLKDVQEMFMTFFVSDYFPFMGWVDKLTGTSARLQKVFMELDQFYEEIIDEHLKTNRPKSGQEDIVDVLLKLRGEKSLGIDITHDHIKSILMNIFVAGTDTSAATLVSAMTELMKNPEAMKKLQKEVRTSMGNKIGDIIKEEDLDKLEYLKAVVKETFRLHPTAPLLVPRETTQKCSIEGYEIQEKTLVFVNAWAIGRDPESWEDPEEFKPERFLGNKPIDFKGQHFELIPFGSGRRICPGLQIGEIAVQLVLANLVYLFNWTLPVGREEEVMDTSVLPGITTHKKIPLCLLAKKP